MSNTVNIKKGKYLVNFEKALPSVLAAGSTKKIVRAASKGDLGTYREAFRTYNWKRTRDYNCVLLIFSPIVIASQEINIESEKRQGQSPLFDKNKQEDRVWINKIDMVNQCLGSTKFKLLCEYIGRGDGYRISKLLSGFREYNRLLGLLVFEDENKKNDLLIGRARIISSWRGNGKYIKNKLVPFVNQVINPKFGEIMKNSMDTTEPEAAPQDFSEKLFEQIKQEIEKHRQLPEDLGVILNAPTASSDLGGKTKYSGYTNDFNVYIRRKLDSSGKTTAIEVWFDKNELLKHTTEKEIEMAETVNTYCDLIQDISLHKPGTVEVTKTKEGGTRVTEKVDYSSYSQLSAGDTSTPPPPPPPPPPQKPSPQKPSPQFKPNTTRKKRTGSPQEQARENLLARVSQSAQTIFQKLKSSHQEVDFLLSVGVEETSNTAIPFFLKTMHFHYAIIPATDPNTSFPEHLQHFLSAPKVKLFVEFTEDDLKHFIPDNLQTQGDFDNAIATSVQEIENNINTLIGRFYNNLKEINDEKKLIKKFEDLQIKFICQSQKHTKKEVDDRQKYTALLNKIAKGEKTDETDETEKDIKAMLKFLDDIKFIQADETAIKIICTSLFDDNYDNPAVVNQKIDEIKKRLKELKKGIPKPPTKPNSDNVGDNMFGDLQKNIQPSSDVEKLESEEGQDTSLETAISTESQEVVDIADKHDCSIKNAKEFIIWQKMNPDIALSEDDIKSLIELMEEHSYTIEKAKKVFDFYNQHYKNDTEKSLDDALTIFETMEHQKIGQPEAEKLFKAVKEGKLAHGDEYLISNIIKEDSTVKVEDAVQKLYDIRNRFRVEQREAAFIYNLTKRYSSVPVENWHVLLVEAKKHKAQEQLYGIADELIDIPGLLNDQKEIIEAVKQIAYIKSLYPISFIVATEIFKLMKTDPEIVMLDEKERVKAATSKFLSSEHEKQVMLRKEMDRRRTNVEPALTGSNDDSWVDQE